MRSRFCTNLPSVTIPGSVTNIGDFAFYQCSILTNATIIYGPTRIGNFAFQFCTNLPSVTIPGSVINIGDYAFADCTSLTSVYFTGNAPTADTTVFYDDNFNVLTTYYLPGTIGWSLTFWGYPSSGPPAVRWDSFGPSGEASFGVQSNQFGFNFTGPANLIIVVEACSNLASPVWVPLQTNTLTNGLFSFSEPLQTNSSDRFYRITSP